jgi:DNA-directed RNA polymerase specialized sigma24 family protein
MAKDKKKKKKSKYYIENEEILPHIYEYRDTGKISEGFGGILLKIATNYACKGSFHGYTWKDDMISEAVMTCIRYMHNFDPMRQRNPNPFAYFTMIIHRSFLTYIRKQKKHSKIKNELYDLYDSEDFAGEEYTAGVKGINYEKLKER